MKKIVTVSAPGKVILFGEHAVVYPEHPAVATALDLKTFCTIEDDEGLCFWMLLEFVS